jgi:hypothetical protein
MTGAHAPPLGFSVNGFAFAVKLPCVTAVFKSYKIPAIPAQQLHH